MKAKVVTRRERGQSLVELAISLPVILLLLLGTLDFGMAIFSYSMLRDAAQEGAFYGSFNPASKEAIENRARYISPRGEDEIFSSPVDLTNPDLVQVDVDALGQACQGITDGTINSMRVTVTYNYPIMMPIIGPLFGSTIPLTGTATNIILQPACP
ncbi:MAG: pilus assembly protein [Anaerolineales bacterium]|jgi:Flp pilus assembly protein TadG|uniref:TadE family protein n=1 Tax=Candidatus Villigracilis affinis TaxID=3140682 RepID=UPI002A1D00B9|nr:pilus assembly protein [Anaerolineales bacterium]MBL0347904.1 pilus assembly protein [Anaerolineales bacterium]